ncbi:testis-expressed protein 26-like [Notolabrus celidotus]|uniref:testis-expressed protein 26-like n=1 Tax=Notolabrus celidotus TaxID=1203425 RepID=UPI00148FC9CC|nr:testis-expressed protein 26-like [Notolabrus celidotus]
MATKEVKQWWDPYETSNRRQFVHQPNSAAEILLCRSPSSTAFIDSYSHSGPLGSTVYKKDFCWKLACKPESIRTGTASGQRRNNPHPSQSFMTWRLPREAARSSDYVSFPWKCSPSEGVIRKALTAQYCSTYRCDFMGMPQGYFVTKTEGGRLAPLYSRPEVPLSADTEMRDNYRKPKRKPELLGNPSNNTDSYVASCGIVPTVVQRHVHSQQKRYDLTNYNRFFGKGVSDVSGVLKSLLPQELQQLQKMLTEEEKEAVKALSKGPQPINREKVSKLPAVVPNSRTPERISSWPGPQ